VHFKNRVEAGRLLADALKTYAGQEGVVYPLPRGGVPLGVEISKALKMDLDLIIPRKIGHPYNPEYAIAAVGETGEPVVNQAEVDRVDQKWFQQEVDRQREESRRRREAYLHGRDPLPVEGKVAILVDDGIATGLTMKAAIQDARSRRPAKLVVAIPVVPADTARRLRDMVDDLVALDIDEYYLGAVGAYYDDFAQTTDEEVIALLS
jgi:putative phosphoribosyl transferase